MRENKPVAACRPEVSLITALRSFEAIAAAENDQCGLAPTLEAVPLSDAGSTARFLSGLLMQAGALLGIAGRDMLMLQRGAGHRFTLVAALGKYEAYTGQDASVVLDAVTLAGLYRTSDSGLGISATAHGIFFMPSADTAIYVDGGMTLKIADWTAVGKYCDKVYQAICKHAPHESVLHSPP